MSLRVINATTIVAENSTKERRAALDGLMNGTYHAVTSVDVFGEGVNIPNVNCIAMLRPTMSITRWRQFLGRGLRKRPDNSALKLLDFADNYYILGTPLADNWDTMGLEARKIVDDGESRPFPTECPTCETPVVWSQAECWNCKMNGGSTILSWVCEDSRVKLYAKERKYNWDTKEYDDPFWLELDVRGCHTRHWYRRYEESYRQSKFIDEDGNVIETDPDDPDGPSCNPTCTDAIKEAYQAWWEEEVQREKDEQEARWEKERVEREEQRKQREIERERQRIEAEKQRKIEEDRERRRLQMEEMKKQAAFQDSRNDADWLNSWYDNEMLLEDIDGTAYKAIKHGEIVMVFKTDTMEPVGSFSGSPAVIADSMVSQLGTLRPRVVARNSQITGRPKKVSHKTVSETGVERLESVWGAILQDVPPHHVPGDKVEAKITSSAGQVRIGAIYELKRKMQLNGNTWEAIQIERGSLG